MASFMILLLSIPSHSPSMATGKMNTLQLLGCDLSRFNLSHFENCIVKAAGFLACRFCVIASFKLPVIQQRRNQYHKARTCVVHQRAGGRIQNAQDGQGHRQQIDAHGQADADLDGHDRRVGQLLQIV